MSILFGSGSDSDTSEIFRIGSDHQILISAQHWNEPHRSQVLFVKIAHGTTFTFTPWSKHLFVIGQPCDKFAKLHTVPASNNGDHTPCSFHFWLFVQHMYGRGGPGPGVRESTTGGFWIFLSEPDPEPESKIWEKTDPGPESFFNFGSSRSLCGHFFLFE